MPKSHFPGISLATYIWILDRTNKQILPLVKLRDADSLCYIRSWVGINQHGILWFLAYNPLRMQAFPSISYFLAQFCGHFFLIHLSNGFDDPCERILWVQIGYPNY